MPIDYGWLATKISGSFGPARIEYHRKYGKTAWRMKPPHKKTLELGSPEANPCAQWRTADALWVSQPESWRQMWRDALKKPSMSGYDLWMKEALTLCSQNKYLPDEPSISGGWSTKKVIAGVTWPPEGKTPPVPPPPPPDYYNCWACPLGSYSTFYARLLPDTPGCRYHQLFPWHNIQVTDFECYWQNWFADSSIYIDMTTTSGIAKLWTDADGAVSEMQFSFAGSPPCLGGYYDILDWESGLTCPHGNHSAYKVQIYGVDY